MTQLYAIGGGLLALIAMLVGAAIWMNSLGKKSAKAGFIAKNSQVKDAQLKAATQPRGRDALFDKLRGGKF